MELFCRPDAPGRGGVDCGPHPGAGGGRGLRFRDIGVVARSYRTYQDLVESVFARYGVPVFSSSMSEILDKPILALVTGALDTVAGGYVYDDVFRYLKTGLTDLGEEDRDLLENYVLKWDIRGSRWTQEKPWTMHPQGLWLPHDGGGPGPVGRVDRARRQVAAPGEAAEKSGPYRTGDRLWLSTAFWRRSACPGGWESGWRNCAGGGARAGRGVPPALGDPVRRAGAVCRPHRGGAYGAGGVLQSVPAGALQYDVGTIPVSLDRVTAGKPPGRPATG